jgi:hypothetical protein
VKAPHSGTACIAASTVVYLAGRTPVEIWRGTVGDEFIPLGPLRLPLTLLDPAETGEPQEVDSRPACVPEDPTDLGGDSYIVYEIVLRPGDTVFVGGVLGDNGELKGPGFTLAHGLSGPIFLKGTVADRTAYIHSGNLVNKLLVGLSIVGSFLSLLAMVQMIRARREQRP